MTTTQPVLHVRVLHNGSRGGVRHLVMLFDQPLLIEGEHRFVTPGEHALDNLDDYSLLMQHIMRALFAQPDPGLVQAVITPEHLTIDHKVFLPSNRIFGIIWRAAARSGLAYNPRLRS